MTISKTSSPLWHTALDKYREELQAVADYQDVQKVHTLEELLSSFASIPESAPATFAGLRSMKRLAPRLKFVDDFSAVIALCFGADAALTAAVWGSIRLILSQASSAADTLQDVIDMIEDLSLTFPRFQVYEKTLPLSPTLQQALLDVYSEIICFYARTIHFLSVNRHPVLRKNAWESFRNDFSRTNLRIKRLSTVVEAEADVARMRQDKNYKEVLDLLTAMNTSRTEETKAVKYSNIPFVANPRFSGRQDILSSLDNHIKPEKASSALVSMALFGMGGVGKTQIAIQHAHQSLSKFDAVLWISADNAISIGQSFRAIAEGLGLLETEEEKKDASVAIYKVKNWMAATSSVCLVVFDNADDLTSLKTAWPTSFRGAVLVTTRDLAVATSFVANHVSLGALDEDAGSKLLLKALDKEIHSSDDQQHAKKISLYFGGLPLALTQIAAFMKQRKMALNTLLPLYERNSAKIDARKASGSDYEYTLSTVWDVSFDKLSEMSTSLLGLLSFFDPDSIAEELFLEGSAGLDEEFSFLSDEMDFGDASEELLGAALIDRLGDPPVLSVHRLVQSAALRRLPATQFPRYFDVVVQILCWGFPDHASEDIGHQIATWSLCEKCLPHVRHLVQLFKAQKNKTEDPTRYANLLLRCSWYLYERELYVIAKEMVEQAISLFGDRSSLEYASAIDLGGLLDIDLAQPKKALEPFQRALEIRKNVLGAEDPFIAYSLNNVALAYTEMGELASALKAHQKAVDLRLKANSDRIGNSYSNLSSLLLRMGQPDEAEKTLAKCPSLKDFTDETFLSTGNPRFSGDMVLLSRIRRAQGRHSEAIRLASKALEFRRQLLGNRLKTCDSQYDVATMLLRDGHVSSSIQLLEEVVGFSETFIEGDGQRARALFKLSEIFTERKQLSQAASYKERALALRASLRPKLKDAPFEEAQFGKLCLWMLW